MFWISEYLILSFTSWCYLRFAWLTSSPSESREGPEKLLTFTGYINHGNATRLMLISKAVLYISTLAIQYLYSSALYNRNRQNKYKASISLCHEQEFIQQLCFIVDIAILSYLHFSSVWMSPIKFNSSERLYYSTHTYLWAKQAIPESAIGQNMNYMHVFFLDYMTSYKLHSLSILPSLKQR